MPSTIHALTCRFLFPLAILASQVACAEPREILSFDYPAGLWALQASTEDLAVLQSLSSGPLLWSASLEVPRSIEVPQRRPSFECMEPVWTSQLIGDDVFLSGYWDTTAHVRVRAGGAVPVGDRPSAASCVHTLADDGAGGFYFVGQPRFVEGIEGDAEIIYRLEGTGGEAQRVAEIPSGHARAQVVVANAAGLVFAPELAESGVPEVCVLRLLDSQFACRTGTVPSWAQGVRFAGRMLVSVGGAVGDSGVWAVDATELSFDRLHHGFAMSDSAPVTPGNPTNRAPFVVVGDRVFWRGLRAAEDGGDAFMASDGSAAGTLQLSPSFHDGRQGLPTLGHLGDVAFFSFLIPTDPMRFAVWVSDGTLAGTHSLDARTPGGEVEPVSYAVHSSLGLHPVSSQGALYLPGVSNGIAPASWDRVTFDPPTGEWRLETLATLAPLRDEFGVPMPSLLQPGGQVGEHAIAVYASAPAPSTGVTRVLAIGPEVFNSGFELEP